MTTIRKDLCFESSALPIHERLVSTYGPKRVYTVGLLLVDALKSPDREHLMSFIGRGKTDLGEIQKAIQKLFGRKEGKESQ